MINLTISLGLKYTNALNEIKVIQLFSGFSVCLVHAECHYLAPLLTRGFNFKNKKQTGFVLLLLLSFLYLPFFIIFESILNFFM